MKQIIFFNSFIYLNKYIDSFLKFENISNDSILFFNFELKEDIEKFQNEYFLNSLFDEKKVLIVKNVNELILKVPSRNFRKFIENLGKNKTQNHLFFIFNSSIVKNGFYEKLKDFSIKEIKSPDKKEFKNFIIDFFRKKNIKYDYRIIRFINNNFSDNFDQLLQELYKYELMNEELTLEFVKNWTFKFDNEFFFQFLNYLFIKDKQKIVENINYLKLHSIDVLFFIEKLINEIALIIQLKIAKKDYSKNKNFITNDDLGINSYRLSKLEAYGNQFILSELINMYNVFFLLLEKFKLNTKIDNYLILKAKLLLNF